MNLDKLKDSVGTLVKVRPAARSRNAAGVMLKRDDPWRIESVDRATGIQLRNIRTDHNPKLNADHVHHFATAPMLPDQVKRGFLELTVTMELDGDYVIVEPIPSGPAARFTEPWA